MAGQKKFLKNFLKNKEEVVKTYTEHIEKVEVDPLLAQKNEIAEQSKFSDKELQEEQIPAPFDEKEEKEAEKVAVEGEQHTYEFQKIEDLAEYDDSESSRSAENPANLHISDAIEQVNERITAVLKYVENIGGNESDVSKEIEEVIKVQREIKDDFDTKLRYDRHKEQLIDKLHKELQEYKEDVVKKAMQPIIRDLIMVNDNIFKLVENYRSIDGELDPEAILKQMSFITTDIDDVLYRQGIEPYVSQDEQVDSLRQKILKTIKVSEKEKEKLIAERVRRGYQWDEKIIRKELVSVYVYDENAEIVEDDQLEGVESK